MEEKKKKIHPPFKTGSQAIKKYWEIISFLLTKRMPK
jgi:hypothetical protein